MRRLKLPQSEIDRLDAVDRTEVKRFTRGFGRNDVGFQTKIDGKNIWQYEMWQAMMGRCLSASYKEAHPSYKDVVVCDEWLSFSNFFEWVNKEVSYEGKPVGMQLDKDILVRGNKTYSTYYCCLVPMQLNSIVIDSAAARGDYPVGVDLNSRDGKFRATLKRYGTKSHIGYYDTVDEAFQAYKIAKEAHIKVVALQYKNMLKPAVFESLMNWEIQNV